MQVETAALGARGGRGFALEHGDGDEAEVEEAGEGDAGEAGADDGDQGLGMVVRGVGGRGDWEGFLVLWRVYSAPWKDRLPPQDVTDHAVSSSAFELDVR